MCCRVFCMRALESTGCKHVLQSVLQSVLQCVAVCCSVLQWQEVCVRLVNLPCVGCLRCFVSTQSHGTHMNVSYRTCKYESHT